MKCAPLQERFTLLAMLAWLHLYRQLSDHDPVYSIACWCIQLLLLPPSLLQQLCTHQ